MSDDFEDLNGRKVVRGDDGKFTRAELDPDEARRMQAERWAKKPREGAKTLLHEAGFDDEKAAPEHLRMLAEMSAAGRTGSVQALGAFLRLTRGEVGGAVAVPADGPCPVCGRYAMPAPSKAELEAAAAILADMRENGESLSD